ncbi:MAG: hypothetical protein FH753_01690 [Firmicutes bacterium]|nr:hypothetical protein [Bacillota bacterium]
MKGNKKWLKFFIIFFLIVSSIYLGSTCYLGYDLYKSATEKTNIAEKITEIKANENFVSIENIPKDFLDAIVAIEDHRFYKHAGIDFISVGRALMTNVISDGTVSGGSTITQQLSKNMFFSFEKKYTRKVAEAIVALKLENKLSKKEILELYVNIIYFGNGNYGIKEASNNYFDVEPKDLTMEQSIIIAGLPQAPSTYKISGENEKTKARIQEVIDALITANYITKDKGDIISNNINNILEY